ncbi:hypothetical protein K701_27155 [Streptomyces fradiae ATCC 10745 = DSM 40063]|uniref:Uncharacterized protein n=1 Tax=Streptomyces fradiae ATCC 10745 = DSM 40063 TaxID=1319510 RepID=A0ABQ6XLK3_STRFR|nr:hypothetical protein K701_27155 [Streptomyces fradiae ATCC 10745 = DSM 40063]
MPEKSTGSSNALHTADRRSARAVSRRSTPSRVIRPDVGSSSRDSSDSSVLLPDPVAPATATVLPARIVRSTPRSAAARPPG